MQVTEGGVYIAITAFQPKMAAALIINDTDLTLEFTEIDLVANTQDRRRLYSPLASIFLRIF